MLCFILYSDGAELKILQEKEIFMKGRMIFDQFIIAFAIVPVVDFAYLLLNNFF
jgi:hypothetical protein